MVGAIDRMTCISIVRRFAGPNRFHHRLAEPPFEHTTDENLVRAFRFQGAVWVIFEPRPAIVVASGQLHIAAAVVAVAVARLRVAEPLPDRGLRSVETLETLGRAVLI